MKTSNQSAFTESIVLPDDSRYPTLVRGFNLRFTGTPKYVQLCGSTTEVQNALQKAVQENMRVTVRGGGHCYEDFVSGNQGGVIIDLSPLNQVYQKNGLYCVEGGCTLWNVYTQLYKEFGVTLPGGSCYSVGAGGHIIGGGYGLLSRKYGLIVDYLYAVEVVRVNANREAEVVYVSRDSTDPDEQTMFWAHTGGGGGNFGIVTKYWFKNPPKAPTYAYLVNLAWDWDELLANKAAFFNLVRNYGHFMKAHSGIDSPFKNLFSILRLTHHSAKQITMTVQLVSDQRLKMINGELELVNKFIQAVNPKPLTIVAQKYLIGHHRNLAGGTSSEARELTWLEATQTLNGVGPNQRGKYKSAYMKEPFPEGQIATLWKYLSGEADPTNTNLDLSTALVETDSYGCQINAIPSLATAVPQRSSILKLQYQVYWKGEAYSQEYINWINQFYVDMYRPYGYDSPYPGDLFDGCYVNYPDVDMKDWQYLYYGENYPRLRQAKLLWDPNNIFNHQQSISLP